VILTLEILYSLNGNGNDRSSFYAIANSVNPEEENVRRESKLSVPNRNIEPAVSTTPLVNEDAVAIRHTPEIKGGLKALQQKGLKITDYHEDIPKPRRK
jgi:hypothetical protein